MTRTLRDELRDQHDAALDPIEDIVIDALDRLAEEAIARGADAGHDFNVDSAAAVAIKLIAAELEQVVTRVC
jgi:hypothetical protein